MKRIALIAVAALAIGCEKQEAGVWQGYIEGEDRKSTRLNSSHSQISYAVFCLKKKTEPNNSTPPSRVLSLLISTCTSSVATRQPVDYSACSMQDSAPAHAVRALHLPCGPLGD